MKNLDKAKEMYFYYACSSFFMDRDGAREEYIKFGVSKEQEKAWRQEYISHWLGQLSHDVFEAALKLETTFAKEAVPELIDYGKRGDSFEKLWIANALWKIVEADKIHISANEIARKAAVEFWQNIVDDGVKFRKKHRHTVEGFALKAFEASTTEEYVYKYAQRKLEDATNPRLVFADFAALLEWIDELSVKLSYMGETKFSDDFKVALAGATPNEILGEVRRVMIMFNESNASGKSEEWTKIWYALKMLDDVLPARPE